MVQASNSEKAKLSAAEYDQLVDDAIDLAIDLLLAKTSKSKPTDTSLNVVDSAYV